MSVEVILYALAEIWVWTVNFCLPEEIIFAVPSRETKDMTAGATDVSSL